MPPARTRGMSACGQATRAAQRESKETGPQQKAGGTS